MKRILLLLIVSISFIPVFAQQKKGHCPWKKEFKEFKMKFMAQEMGLKEDQQQKFFELYGQMMGEKDKVMKEAFDMKRKVEQMKNATDADYKEASEAIADAKIKDSQIEKKYDEKFSSFLSQKQIFKMKEAERKFREKLNRMKHNGKMKKQKMKKR